MSAYEMELITRAINRQVAATDRLTLALLLTKSDGGGLPFAERAFEKLEETRVGLERVGIA